MPHWCISSIMKYYFNKTFHLSIARRQDHSWGIRWIFVVLNCLFLMTKAHLQQVQQCMPYIPTAGWTEPRGDIIIKHGDNLQIWCNLDETYVAKKYPGLNSSNIYFIRDNTTVEQKFITTINKTTALLTIESPPAGYYMYFCHLDVPDDIDAAVCLNAVLVSCNVNCYEPQLPSNFTCRSYDWESLTCTWKIPKNYIPTTYKLFYQIEENQTLYSCPTEKTKSDSCTWTEYTNPMYRKLYENYTFVMQIKNTIAKKIVIYKVNHFSIVFPAKTLQLSVINITSDSATLCWRFRLSYIFPPGLNHKIMYQSQWDSINNWKIINIHTKTHDKTCFILTGLYANAAYYARVYLRNPKAEIDMYSVPADVNFRTLSTLPSFPPRTDIGSFEIVENNGNRDVYLYWQRIEEYYENGNDFKYQINHIEENGHKIDLEPIEMTKTYAKFKELNFDKYQFRIVSENKIGINKNYTEIIVPSQNFMPHEPIAFTIIAFENRLYELFWKPLIMPNDIMNYTIFWCDNEREPSYQCTGYLNWIHVPMNSTVYNITVPETSKIYQFAISVNTNQGSSGMIWSTCTVIYSKELRRMKSVWINRVGLDFIEVGWYLGCIDRIGIIQEIKIYYCPIMSVLNNTCKVPKRSITVKYYLYTIHGIVENLTPYTTYMLEVTMVTKYGESWPSKSLYSTTLEASTTTSYLNV